MPPRLSKCSSCGAAIYWVITAPRGSLMPIDAKPVDSGNVLVWAVSRPTVIGSRNIEVGNLIAKVSSDSSGSAGQHRYTSHFATCPNAKEHRK